MIFEATQATWMVTKWRTSSVRPSERRPLDNHWMMRHCVTEMFCRVFFEMFTICSTEFIEIHPEFKKQSCLRGLFDGMLTVVSRGTFGWRSSP